MAKDSSIAQDLAEAFIRHDKQTVAELSCRIDARKDGMAVIQAFAERAAQARQVGQNDVVSRLHSGAYRYCPATVPKEVVRQMFAAAGAVGHKPPAKQERLGISTLALIKG